MSPTGWTRAAPRDTHPQLVVVVEGVEQLDDVAVVALRQDVDLHDVILQLLLALSVDHLGGRQSPRLLVPSLRTHKQSLLPISLFLA